MSLNSLPAEVQIEIFSYLQGFNLKTVRGVCRAFRDNAEPSLFRCVIATARYQSLGAFQKISLFPVFQNHVKEIVFDGSVYDELLAKHEMSYHRQAARLLSIDQGFQWHKHSRWKRYAQLFKEQEEMKTDGILVHTLSRALEWLPNVTCITYSPYPRHLPIEAKEMRDLIPRGVTITPTAGYTSTDHPFRQLIAAIYLSQFTGIRELRSEGLGSDPGTEFALGLFGFQEDEMAVAKYLFQRLEKISLNIAMRVPNTHDFGDTLDKFVELLRTSVNLQQLYLHPTHWRPEIDAHRLFARLGMGTTWSKLQSLSLEEMLADEEELLDMIKRHTKTLLSVRFSKCSLLKGSWAEIVDEVLYGTKLFPFILDCVNERGLPALDYSSLSESEKECWKYEGMVQVTEDGDRTFFERNPAKKSVYDLRKGGSNDGQQS